MAERYYGQIIKSLNSNVYGFIGAKSVRSLTGERAAHFDRDIYIHVDRNPRISRLSYRGYVAFSLDTRGSNKRFMAVDAEVFTPTRLNNNDIQYEGKLVDVSKNGSVGFVSYNSIKRADGLPLENPSFHGDIRLHVRENPQLGDPLPEGLLVNFYLLEDSHPRSRDGIMAVDAVPA